MTQYLAKCLNCGSMVQHLEQSATVDRCDECKGQPGKLLLSETAHKMKGKS